MDENPKSVSGRTTGISRREFARRAAVTSVIAAVAPSAATLNEHANVAAADRRGRSSDPSTVAAPEQQPTDLSKLSPESRAEVEARTQTILNQYGSRFSDAQKADLRKLCASVQPPLDRLRAYALENGDSPALYLKPLVEREKNPLENTRVGKTPAASQNP